MVFMGLIKALLELYILVLCFINPINTKLNPICHLLALLGAHHILHVSRIRVKVMPDVSILEVFFFLSTNCILIDRCP